MAEHTVQQGEHISTLAKKYGFYDYNTIWNDPTNQDLQSDRDNPNVLFPGDVVTIPDKKPKAEDRPTAQSHTFQVKSKVLKLRIAIKSYFDEVIANTKCVLEIQGKPFTEQTDANGLVEAVCDPLATEGKLVIRGSELEVQIGSLDPVDKPSGQVARLNNLGYGAGPIDAPDQDLLQSAIEEFQADQNIRNGPGGRVTGVCDDTTQARLKKVHGC
jgi:hypothetical protein